MYKEAPCCWCSCICRVYYKQHSFTRTVPADWHQLHQVLADTHLDGSRELDDSLLSTTGIPANTFTFSGILQLFGSYSSIPTVIERVPLLISSFFAVFWCLWFLFWVHEIWSFEVRMYHNELCPDLLGNWQCSMDTLVSWRVHLSLFPLTLMLSTYFISASSVPQVQDFFFTKCGMYALVKFGS